MAGYNEMRAYLDKVIYSMPDLERIKTVITMCEGLEVIIDDDRIIITNKPGVIDDKKLQKIWNECWNNLKMEGIKNICDNC